MQLVACISSPQTTVSYEDLRKCLYMTMDFTETKELRRTLSTTPMSHDNGNDTVVTI